MTFRAAVHTNDAQLYLLLRHILAQEGVIAQLTTTDGELISLCQNHSPELIIIDTALPGGNNMTLFRACKNARSSLALALLYKGAEETFADDHTPPLIDLKIAFPFDPILIIKLIKSIRINTSQSSSPRDEQQLTYADVELHPSSMKVRRRGRNIFLTSLQFKLLQTMMSRPTIIHSRDELIAAGWPPHCEVEHRTVDVHIGLLRRSLTAHGPDIIRTIRGKGYAIDVQNSPP